MEAGFSIVALDARHLKEACRLVDAVFPDEDYPPGKELKASLDPREFKAYLARYDADILAFEYWVAVDTGGRVLGTVGLYSQREDAADSLWLGWFCVDPAARGRGLGAALLDFATAEAARRGRRFLRLYTSTDPGEAAAQFLYEARGFRVTKRVREEGWELLYREKALS